MPYVPLVRVHAHMIDKISILLLIIIYKVNKITAIVITYGHCFTIYYLIN